MKSYEIYKLPNNKITMSVICTYEFIGVENNTCQPGNAFWLFKDKILRTKVGIYALSPNPKYKLIYSC